MNTKTANKTISIFTGVLVSFLAASAFVLSYDALYRLALANGITPQLAWLWPLCLDAMMIAASLSVLRNGISGERSWYQWGLVAMFTAASITFNMIHAPNDTILARAVFALPPLVTFLSFELLVSQIKSGIKRAGINSTLRAMQEAVSRAQTEVSELSNEADTLTRQNETLQAERDTLLADTPKYQGADTPKPDTTQPKVSKSSDTRVSGIKSERQAQALGIIEAEPSITGAQLAERLGVSLITGKRYLAEIRKRRNGHNQQGISDTVMVSDTPVSSIN